MDYSILLSFAIILIGAKALGLLAKKIKLMKSPPSIGLLTFQIAENRQHKIGDEKRCGNPQDGFLCRNCTGSEAILWPKRDFLRPPLTFARRSRILIDVSQY